MKCFWPPASARAALCVMLALVGAQGAAAQAVTTGALPERKPTFVRVLDAAGQPLAGAEVTFAGGSPYLTAGVLPVDVQRVASDARGRARARLLPGLCYVAVASGASGTGRAEETAGTQLVSQPHGLFGAGAMFELSCTAAPVRRVEMRGTAAWSAVGPLRFFLVSPHPGFELELERAVDGTLLLPPQPDSFLEVRTRDGEPLWSGGMIALVEQHFELPPPRVVRVRVLTADGAPVPAARIRQRVGRRSAWHLDGTDGITEVRMREVGTTDAEGRATVTVPYDTDPMREPTLAEMMLFVDAPGYALAAGGLLGKRCYLDDRRVEEFAGDEFVFTLAKAVPLEAVPGLLPPGTTGQLVAVCKLYSRGNNYMHDARIFATTVTGDGRLAFDNVPADVHSLRVSLVLPDGTPCVFASLMGRTFPPELTVVKGGLLRDRVAEVRIRALDVMGGPARGAIACVVPAGAVPQRDSMFRLPLDSAGRSSLFLSTGRWVVILVTAVGYCATEEPLQANVHELDLKLEPLATMGLVLHDADGEPVRGARLHLGGSNTRATPDPRQSVMRMFAREMRQRWNDLVTDGDGAVTVPFLPADGVTWTVSLRWVGGATEEFVIEANDAPLRLQPK